MSLVRRMLAMLVVAVIAAACGAALPLGGSTPTKDPLAGIYIARGGGGALDAVVSLTKAFDVKHPGITWQGLDDIGSDAAVKLVQSGEIDLGFISRDLKPSEVGMVDVTPIGVSGTGLAVASNNPVTGLTKEQLARIYTGDITDWSAVGGNPGPIRVLIREAGSATRSAFEAYCFAGKAPAAYAKNAIEVLTYEETVRSLKSFQGAIGMMSLSSAAYAEPAIRLLALDGVPATHETLASGSYKMRRPLYLVYNSDAGKMKPAIRAFLDFVQGPQGQNILGGL